MSGMQFHAIIMGNEFSLKGNFRGIVYSTSAFLVWKVLKKMFDKINGSQLLTIHREIGTLTQGDWCIYILHKAEATMDEYTSLPNCSSHHPEHILNMITTKIVTILNGIKRKLQLSQESDIKEEPASISYLIFSYIRKKLTEA